MMYGILYVSGERHMGGAPNVVLLYIREDTILSF